MKYTPQEIADASAFVSRGLGWILDRIPDMARTARLQNHTNDVAIILFVGADVTAAKVYGVPRSKAMEVVQEATPNAVQTLARLAEGPVGIDHVLVLVYVGGDIFSLIAPLPKTTDGTLN
jgi:hypothetical protein